MHRNKLGRGKQTQKQNAYEEQLEKERKLDPKSFGATDKETLTPEEARERRIHEEAERANELAGDWDSQEMKELFAEGIEEGLDIYYCNYSAKLDLERRPFYRKMWPIQQSIARVITEHADEKTGWSTMTQKEIAYYAVCSTRHVRRHMNAESDFPRQLKDLIEIDDKERNYTDEKDGKLQRRRVRRLRIKGVRWWKEKKV